MIPADETEGVAHAAFFSEVGKWPEGSTESEILIAGLLVLRLLDRWRVRAQSNREVSFREFIATKRRVESLAETPVRRVLADLINTISAFAYGRADTRANKVIVFAQFLEDLALWDPAADAYCSAADILESPNQGRADRELLPMCFERAAYCLRQLEQVDQAEALCDKGMRIARELEDTYWCLRIRIGLALLEVRRGDLPSAESELDYVIEDAEAANIREMIAWAKHERGHVAYDRREWNAATLYFHAAAGLHVDPAMVQRAKLDLALALGELGHRDYARRLYGFAREGPSGASDLRPLAGVNLLRLAFLDEDESTFDRLRHELADERMSGKLRAHYHLFSGQGLKLFGNPDAARVEFLKAIEVAEAYRINRLIIEAEELLKATDESERPKRAIMPTARPASALDPSLRAILDDIDSRRGPFAGAATD